MSDPKTPDDGFSLIEVIVALGLFLLVMTAVLPLMIGGLRGAARAGQVTEEKGSGYFSQNACKVLAAKGEAAAKAPCANAKG